MQDGTIRDYWSSDSLIDVFRVIFKKAGLHNASSHSGRKSIVTTGVVKNGRSLEQMAQILGHSDPSITLDYVDIDKERLKEAYRLVDL